MRLKKRANVYEVLQEREIGEMVSEFTEEIPKHTTRLYRVL